MKISEMVESLRQPVPAALTKVKESQGTKITFLPWYGAVALADARLGGRWSHEVVQHWTDDALRGSKDRGYSETALAHVRVRVTLHGDDRDVSREAVGVDDEPTGQRGTPLERAEAAGIRRALAKFGLGLHLYGGADAYAASQAPVQAPPRQAPAKAAPAKAEPRADDPDDRKVADTLSSIADARSVADLTKLGQEIKSNLTPAQQALVKGQYLEALGALRRAEAVMMGA